MKSGKVIVQAVLFVFSAGQLQGQFSKIETGSTENINQIACNSDFCIISGWYNFFFKTYNSGVDLIPITNPRFLNESADKVIHIKDSTFYMQTISADGNFAVRILKSMDGGSVWTQKFDTTGVLRGFSMLNDSIGLLTGSFGRIYTTTDGWNSWDYSTYGGGDFVASTMVTDSVGFIGGFGGASKTSDSCQSWNLSLDSPNMYAEDFEFVNTSIGYVIADGELEDDIAIYKTYDTGENWERLLYLKNYDVYDLHFLDSLEGYAVGKKRFDEYGVLYVTYDGGENWHIVNMPWEQALIAIDFSNDSTFLIGGTDGLLLRGDRYALRDTLLSDTTDPTVSAAPVSDLKHHVSVFPNPAEDIVSISLHLPEQSQVVIDLYSMDRKKVKTIFRGIMVPGENTLKCPLKGLENGIYFFSIGTSQTSITKKIMKY